MSQIRSIDHGYKALVQRVFEFHRPQISVGIFEREGAMPKASGHVNSLADTIRIEQVMTVIEVACINEFGDGHTPSRSFIRDWFDNYKGKNYKMLYKLCNSVIKGERTQEEILEILGLVFVADIQLRITNRRIAPENAPSTIAKKGSDVPLIDTGQLRSSITYKAELR